jgi:hypothetical protein
VAKDLAAVCPAGFYTAFGCLWCINGLTGAADKSRHPVDGFSCSHRRAY